MQSKRDGYPVLIPHELQERAINAAKLPTFPHVPGEKPTKAQAIRLALRLGLDILEGKGGNNAQ